MFGFFNDFEVSEVFKLAILLECLSSLFFLFFFPIVNYPHLVKHFITKKIGYGMKHAAKITY